jgi:deoxyadenosine/deoxycytidine kinase
MELNDEVIKLHNFLSEKLKEQGKSQLIVILDGNIGSGKTTLITELEKRYPVLYQSFPESLGFWTHFVKGINLLEQFYANPSEGGFLFNLLAFLTSATLLDKYKFYKPINIIERSFFSTRHIFIELLKSKQILKDSEFKALEAVFDVLEEKVKLKIDFGLVLNVDVFECLARVIERARKGEENINIEYLNRLEEKQKLLASKVPYSIIEWPLSNV